MGSIARGESERTSKRVRDKQAENAAIGKPHGGNRAYGYELDGMTIRESEAAIIREIADRLLHGESQRGLALDFTARGVPTANGGRWTPDKVKATVIRPRNAGIRERNGIHYPAAWKPILDPAVWKRVTSLLTDPSRSANTGKRGRPIQLLTGIATCSLCGTTLKATPRGGKASYTCRRTALQKGCNGVSIDAGKLHDMIIPAVVMRLGSIQQQTPESYDADDQSDMEALERINRQRQELADEWARGEIPRADYRRDTDALGSVEAGINQRMRSRVRENAPAVLIADLHDLDVDGFTDWTIDQQRMAVRAVLEELVITPAIRKGSNVFDRERVKATWRI